jgi:hypothetical protein
VNGTIAPGIRDGLAPAGFIGVAAHKLRLREDGVAFTAPRFRMMNLRFQYHMGLAVPVRLCLPDRRAAA